MCFPIYEMMKSVVEYYCCDETEETGSEEEYVLMKSETLTIHPVKTMECAEEEEFIEEIFVTKHKNRGIIVKDIEIWDLPDWDIDKIVTDDSGGEIWDKSDNDKLPEEVKNRISKRKKFRIIRSKTKLDPLVKAKLVGNF